MRLAQRSRRCSGFHDLVKSEEMLERDRECRSDYCRYLCSTQMERRNCRFGNSALQRATDRLTLGRGVFFDDNNTAVGHLRACGP